MKIDLISLFPEYFTSPFDTSILKRAREKKILDIDFVNIRKFGYGKHSKVDDRPYGGGPGMILMAEPVCQAINSVKTETSYVVYLSPQGKVLTNSKCQELAQKDHIIFLCGHYEGVDERIVISEVDEEISIGDYVLTNGCLAAIVVIDAMARFIPGVLGDPNSARQDTFYEGIFEGPLYTAPKKFKGMEVPPILTSGHHEKINEWRFQKGMEKTRRVRPELFNQGERNETN